MNDIEAIMNGWDGEEVILHFDRPSGAWFIIAIHSTRLGPAVGGTRLRHYGSLAEAVEDALRLARAMTYKFAVADFPRGGGKAVIAVPEPFEEGTREDLIRRYGLLLGRLGDLFTTGPDVGTSSSDMNLIFDVAPGRAFSRTIDHGGRGSSGPPTARGVLASIEAACEVILDRSTLQGISVLVQGAGNVGGALIELLQERGAAVCFTDVDAKTIGQWTSRGLEFVPPQEAYARECDVFSPCGLSGVLNRNTIPRLRCRIVAGAANSQLAEEADAKRLKASGIAYVPDFVANGGGAIAITGMEALEWSPEEAERHVRALGNVARNVLRMAARDDISTHEAAVRLAEQRLGMR